jgi:hypothetical protein
LTFGLLDESQHFLKSNGGHRLAPVLRRSAAKMDGRTLELANAPELGEDSVAEQTEADFAAGHPGILFMANRPPPSRHRRWATTSWPVCSQRCTRARRGWISPGCSAR